MVSKVKVDSIETTAGTGTIALNNQLSGMTVASLPSSGALPALDGSSLTGVGVPGATGSASGLPTLRLDRTTTGSTQFVSQNSNSNGAMFQFNNDTSIQIHTRSSGTDTERLRILPGGGITFNGDSAAANALDDYEEGEILNALSIDGQIQTSYSSGRGGLRYTKIGNICHCWGYLDTQGATLVATGYVRIRLPFAVVSNSESANVFTTGTQFMYCNNDGGSHKAGWIYLADGSSAVEVTQITGASISMASTSDRFYGPFGFTYRTN